ncbi:MAG: hypothetical protein AB7T63_02730 [Planctomycetota bacterium]
MPPLTARVLFVVVSVGVAAALAAALRGGRSEDAADLPPAGDAASDDRGASGRATRPGLSGRAAPTHGPAALVWSECECRESLQGAELEAALGDVGTCKDLFDRVSRLRMAGSLDVDPAAGQGTRLNGPGTELGAHQHALLAYLHGGHEQELLAMATAEWAWLAVRALAPGSHMVDADVRAQVLERALAHGDVKTSVIAANCVRSRADLSEGSVASLMRWAADPRREERGSALVALYHLDARDGSLAPWFRELAKGDIEQLGTWLPRCLARVDGASDDTQQLLVTWANGSRPEIALGALHALREMATLGDAILVAIEEESGPNVAGDFERLRIMLQHGRSGARQVRELDHVVRPSARYEATRAVLHHPLDAPSVRSLLRTQLVSDDEDAVALAALAAWRVMRDEEPMRALLSRASADNDEFVWARTWARELSRMPDILQGEFARVIARLVPGDDALGQLRRALAGSGASGLRLLCGPLRAALAEGD